MTTLTVWPLWRSLSLWFALWQLLSLWRPLSLWFALWQLLSLWVQAESWTQESGYFNCSGSETPKTDSDWEDDGAAVEDDGAAAEDDAAEQTAEDLETVARGREMQQAINDLLTVQ